MQRRELLAAGLGALLGAPALAAAPASFAAGAPELAPLAGWDGQGREAGGLRIEGRLPRGLRGVYYRNGPGLMERAGRRYEHWFDGDGLLQAWHFEDGGVRHQARFVNTNKFRAEQEAGRFMLPTLGTAIKPELPIRGADSLNTANTSVMQLDGRLYALWEGGSAYELDAQNLQTRGPKAWAPDLQGMPFSAHPKLEPDGTLWNFGTMNGRLVVYQISPRGQLLRHAVLKLPVPAMVHDFVVSQRHLIFLLPPLSLNMQAVRAGQSMVQAMRWQAGEATRVLVIDKADFQRQRLLEMPATMMFHFGNAWDEGDEIHLDYVRSPPMTEFNVEAGQMMRGERPAESASTPAVLHLSLTSGRLRQDSRDEAVEFPVVDPRVVARRHRQVFYTHAADAGGRWGANALMRLDLDSGRRERFVFGADVVVEEHVLVPKSGSQREGEGWLVGMGYDLRRRLSFASVFDAEALSAGPLARVWLPYWVPYGFHGKFYAS